jgi:TatA/E family protein of Tat protein translocase
MIGDLFDSPWKILIIAVVLIVLFGSRKLPHAARSLGQSMRILKKEVQGLHEDDADEPSGDAPVAAIAARQMQDQHVAQDQHATQIDALQQQLRDLQRAAGAPDPAPVAADRH